MVNFFSVNANQYLCMTDLEEAIFILKVMKVWFIDDNIPQFDWLLL